MKIVHVVSLFLALCSLIFPSQAVCATKTGAQILSESGYEAVKGKRVGLVTNHTALVGATHLIDLMHASGSVRLSALFAPEHGLRGEAEDGATVLDGRDRRTGVPVFSLYGKNRKPTAEMLRDVDVLVFDIQDIGARFYTFISTMGLAMQAAADAHIPFVVLDRPNPLGGLYVSGYVLEKEQESFVGLYPVPVVHGMTVGELATMIKGEGMLPGLEGLDLRVVKMEGWRRNMQWPDTGLPWVKTSPNIPTFVNALVYPGICFLEGTSLSAGRGTAEPFLLLGAPDLSSERVLERIKGASLPGMRFEKAEFTPRSLPGSSSRPKYLDRSIGGLRLVVSDRRSYRPLEAGIHLLCAFYGASDQASRERFFKEKGFNQLAGTARLLKSIRSGESPEAIVAGWQDELQKFMEKRKKYLLY